MKNTLACIVILALLTACTSPQSDTAQLAPSTGWRVTVLDADGQRLACPEYNALPQPPCVLLADVILPAVTDTPTTPTSTAPATSTPTLPVPTATATNAPTLIPASATPLPALALLNPSFESGAQSWAIYNVTGSAEWNIESLANGADPRAVLDGDQSLRFIVPGNYGVWRAGAFQRVRVGLGRMVTFSVSAYFKAGTSSGLDENRIREIASHFDVGIDPAGGQSRDAAGIVWNRGGGDYQWQARTVTAQALGEWVTVFVEAGVGGEWSFPFSLCFIDGAALR